MALISFNNHITFIMANYTACMHAIKDEGQRMHGKLSQLAIPVHVRMYAWLGYSYIAIITY